MYVFLPQKILFMCQFFIGSLKERQEKLILKKNYAFVVEYRIILSLLPDCQDLVE